MKRPRRRPGCIYEVADPDFARSALASDLTSDSEGSFSLVRDSRNQRDTVVLGLRFDGDRLVVDANSDERATEAEALVRRLLPDAVLLDHDRPDLDD